MTGIRGLSLGVVGPNSRPGGPGTQHYPVTAALLLLPACLSLAGPERAAEAHGPSLSWPAHCQGSAFRGMYGQDGTLHFTNPGKGERRERGDLACRLFLNRGANNTLLFVLWNRGAAEGKAAESESSCVVCFWIIAALKEKFCRAFWESKVLNVDCLQELLYWGETWRASTNKKFVVKLK